MNNLVGKSFKHIPPEKLYSYQRMLYQARMGYVDPFNPTPFDSIKYYPEEHAYEHDLSIQQVGRVYTRNKLEDVMPLKLYLDLPIDVGDELITGMTIGVKERLELEVALKEKEEDDERKRLAAQSESEHFNQLRE